MKRRRVWILAMIGTLLLIGALIYMVEKPSYDAGMRHLEERRMRDRIRESGGDK